MNNNNNRPKTIFDEISNYIPNKSKEELVDIRARNIITSVLNLFESIDQNFDPTDAENLKRRFISSIRNGDSGRFSRAIIKTSNKTK